MGPCVLWCWLSPVHTPKAGGNLERVSLPSPCLEVSLRDGKIYKLNRLQEVSLRPREVLSSWKRGWIAQGFQPERPGSSSFSSQAGSHWPFPAALLHCYRSRLHHFHPRGRAVGVGNTWNPESVGRFHFTFSGTASQGSTQQLVCLGEEEELKSGK